MITREDLRKFSRNMKQCYVDALLQGGDVMRDAGLFENERRLCHFMGQFGAETDGGVIVRESLSYTTCRRLREVWPARFRNKPDSELKCLLRNPVALGDVVYGGRMGNKDPGDGYRFAGGGFLQTTGREALETYCRKLGLNPDPEYLNDANVTLRFACLEWKESNCNKWADENNVVAVSKAINTGSATSNVTPVGMNERRQWLAKATSVWGEQSEEQLKSLPFTKTQVATAATAAAVATDKATDGKFAAPDLSALSNWQQAGQTIADFSTFVIAHPLVMLGAVILGLGIFYVPGWLNAVRS